MEPEERLSSGGVIYYLDPDHILDYANIQLVSHDGHIFTSDKTVLAAASHLLRKVLSDQGDHTEGVVINTELSKPHLALFCQFVTTGTIPVRAWDTQLISSFIDLGVSLSQ